jgi:choline-sulfatase
MSFLEYSARVPLIVFGPNVFEARRVREPSSLCDIMPTLCDIATSGKSSLARAPDGRSLYPLLKGSFESPQAMAVGEYLAEGAVAPIYMIRQGRWKFIMSEPDPDQLFDLDSDPDELDNLAAAPRHRSTVENFRGILASRFDAAATRRKVMESQRCRHMMFTALKRGNYFPWDFQPLRDASEQYTRNHMDVTERDIQSRFPRAAEARKRKT